jgi:transcriptional regulator with XRE-family HTH domain
METEPLVWQGTLAQDELAKPGGMLLAMLVGAARERRESLNKAALQIGVSYGYINQLRSGARSVRLISDDFAQNCAHYLGISRIKVLIASGRLRAEELLEATPGFQDELNAAVRYIVAANVTPCLPVEELQNASVALQFSFVQLYERATSKRLLSLSEDLLDFQQIADNCDLLAVSP